MTCKAAGCDGPALKRSGPYALLCKVHVEERRAERFGHVVEPATIMSVDPSSNGAGPLEEASRLLVELARSADEARVMFQAAQEQYEAAVGRLARAGRLDGLSVVGGRRPPG